MKKSQLIKIIKEEVAEVLQKITEQEDPRLEKLNKLIPDRLNKISLAVGDVERALNAIETISKEQQEKDRVNFYTKVMHYYRDLAWTKKSYK